MTTVADIAKTAAFHCEGNLHAFRKSQAGIVVSFTLDPADVPQQLALAPLGTRYTIALVERGDDEEPISRDPAIKPVRRPPGIFAGSTPNPPPDSLAGAHIKSPARVAAARERWAEASEVERLVIKAAMFTKDNRFWRWAGVKNEEDANRWILAECGVPRKRAFHDSPEACERFRVIATDYEIAAGLIASPLQRLRSANHGTL